MSRDYLIPNWPAPKMIRALTTTRQQGHSQAPFDAFNLATYVDDDPEAVASNVSELIDELDLPESPTWLHQVHGTNVVRIEDCKNTPDADAGFTKKPHKICAVLTADCLPLLLCNQDGTEVAAIHAGWKGLLAGVIDAGINALDTPPDDLLVWMGPALCPEHFEVGNEVRADFINKHPDNNLGFIRQQGRWHLDFYRLAIMNLHRCGITHIYGGDHCTFTEDKQFFSYRRDNGVTGRMASLIYIT